MFRTVKPAALLALMLLSSACSGQNVSNALPQPAMFPSSHGDVMSFLSSTHQQPANVRAACGGPAPAGFARCIALVRTDAAGASLASISSSYGPADLQAAYALPSNTGGRGQTVAIVDAMNDPTALADVTKYRSTFHLPACTVASRCFTVVNQLGNSKGPFPANDAGWSQEISLDLDMVSAICPNCHILLVEARSASLNDLAAAVDTAARLGAQTISNSYGGSEFRGEMAAQSHFNHPGVMITASSGDSGFGPQFPAASQYVTAVGGTSLARVGSTFSESVWSGAGSGCSAFVPKPAWQTDTGCRNRTIADVSAVADPNTGVTVIYKGGFYIFGGTSVSSPIIASVYALAGNSRLALYGRFPYRHLLGLRDVKSGSNGQCSPLYLCRGMSGYDGPSGLGTPNGVSAF